MHLKIDQVDGIASQTGGSTTIGSTGEPLFDTNSVHPTNRYQLNTCF